MSSLFFFGFAFYSFIFYVPNLIGTELKIERRFPPIFPSRKGRVFVDSFPPRRVLKLLKGSSSAAPATGRLNYKYEQKKCKKCTASTPSAEGTLRGLSLLYIYEVHEEQEPFNLHTHLGQSAVKRTESRNSSRITILPELARK